jgi:hypothetical protein
MARPAGVDGLHGEYVGLGPLDEYPIHQLPRPVAWGGSSDRHFYDRCYLNCHDRTGDLFLITGMGFYPNLGTKDAFVLLRRGDTQTAVHLSDAADPRGGDRMGQQVGAYRVEVIEPLHRLRVVMEETEGIAVTPDVWTGSRDRSWGIRPQGEALPAGKPADPAFEGMWWLYVPIGFDEFCLCLIIQEAPDGYRVVNDCTRVWKDGRVEQLGWPRVEIRYGSGTRVPTGATITCATPEGKEVTFEVTSHLAVPIHVGGGYGGDSDWSHGVWKGAAFTERLTYDLNDPAVAGRVMFGVIDHVGSATVHGPGAGVPDGSEGWGLFEHGALGRHDPSGFADWFDLAP